MISLMRKHHQTLMIVVTAMVIIAFVWLYNSTNLDQLGQNVAVRAYGREVGLPEFQRKMRSASLCMSLGLYELYQGLAGMNFDPDQAASAFVMNQLVLEHEASELLVDPTPQQIEDGIKAMPSFQTNGAYDPVKYAQFVESSLGPNGFTVAALEDLIRLDLKYRRVKELVTSSAAISPHEVRSMYERRSAPLTVQLVRVDRAQFKAEVADAEIEAYYKDHTADLNSDEKRRVHYVVLKLTEEEKKLEIKERVAALQKLADQANALDEALGEKGAVFEEVAKRFGLEVKTSGEFAASSSSEFPGAPAAAQAAFGLTLEAPVSSAIQFDGGFYILALESVTPSHPLTLEEAKDEVRDTLLQEKIANALEQKTTEIRASLLAAIGAGKSFQEAAKAISVEPKQVGPFSLTGKPPEGVNLGEFARQTIGMKQGELSEAITTPNGALLVYLDARGAVDEEVFKKEEGTLRTQLLESKQRFMMMEWLSVNREAAGIVSVM